MNRMTLTLGASKWQITIPTDTGPVTYDFRKMTKDERRKFHAVFMASWRKAHPYNPKKGI